MTLLFSTRGRSRAAWLFGTLLVTAFACSGGKSSDDDDDDSCSVGQEHCRCTMDGRCLSGLTCLDKKCADVGEAGDGGMAGDGVVAGSGKSGASSGGTKGNGTGGLGDAGAQDGGASNVTAGGTGGAVSAGTGGGGTSGDGSGGTGGDVAGTSGSAGNPTGGGGSSGTGASNDCGNGQVEAGETCDRGADNGLFYGDGMGCSKTCTQEPKCRGDDGVTRACDTHCGDGNIDDGEECDDGNAVSGDGCADDCTVEDGFTCSTTEVSDAVPCPSNPSLQCLVLPMIFRDFDPSTNPDFFYLGKNSVTCVPDASGTAPAAVAAGGTCPDTDQAGPCKGLASATLDKDGTPAAGTTTMCRCVFTDWDNTGIIDTAPNCTVSGDGSSRHRIDTMIKGIADIKKWYAGDGLKGTLELAQSGAQYVFSSSVMGAPAGAAGTTVTDDVHANCLGTTTPLQSGFFPLDATSEGTGAGTKYCNLWPYWKLGTSEASCATGSGLTIKSQWDPLASYDNCPTTGTGGAVPKSDGTGTALQGQKHDFYYTSVARYLFRYSGTPSQLQFFGDDDVWVYVNGKLKLDLGAPHKQLSGMATIGDSADGLVTGKIYEIAVFHADRHPRDANYQLSVSGFSRIRSSCQPQ